MDRDQDEVLLGHCAHCGAQVDLGEEGWEHIFPQPACTEPEPTRVRRNKQ